MIGSQLTTCANGNGRRTMHAAEARPLDGAALGAARPSSEALDARLRELVTSYGQRWHVISAHIQSAFSLALTSRWLERRWLELQREEAAAAALKRSPLSVGSADSALSELELGLPPPAKRARDEHPAEASVQPPRPPPPPSPAPRGESLPNGCPTFVLAPGSALSAPDAVRRQLKAAYLASLLHRSPRTEPKPRWAAARPPAASPLAAPESEKVEIVELLSRELSSFRRRSPSSVSSLTAHLPVSPGARPLEGLLPPAPSPIRVSLQR
jgi:hypothetical protein